MVIFDGFSEFASHEWPCSVLSSICEPRFGGGPVVVAGEWLYRGAEIHRCSHGASYPYHYHQPPPLHRSVVDSSASTTFSRTPTKSYTATEPLRIVVSSSLFIPSSRESQSVSSSATTFCSSSSSPSSCATTSSSFCVSFVRFLFITELPDALCVSSRYTQLSSAMGSSLGCTVHRYSPRTAPSSHSSLSPPPPGVVGLPVLSATLCTVTLVSWWFARTDRECRSLKRERVDVAGDIGEAVFQ